MKSFNALARIAYAAYVKHAVGGPLPAWAGLNVEHQASWIEAVKAVVAEVATIR